MHRLGGALYARTESERDGLVTQAHSQDRSRAGQSPDQLQADARLLGRPGAGPDQDAVRRRPQHVPHIDSIVLSYVAVGTERGLVVPVVRDADKKSFAQVERDLADYAKKARDGKITVEDLQGGVFSISNGGIYGSLLSTSCQDLTPVSNLGLSLDRQASPMLLLGVGRCCGETSSRSKICSKPSDEVTSVRMSASIRGSLLTVSQLAWPQSSARPRAGPSCAPMAV